jgi:hypothetical protein
VEYGGELCVEYGWGVCVNMAVRCVCGEGGELFVEYGWGVCVEYGRGVCETG